MKKELVIDVSHWDGNVDFGAWKDRRDLWGVIIKAGGNEGGRYRDSRFEANYDKARAAGLHVGFYYYTTVTDPSAARADAEHLLSLVGDRDFDLPAYVDVEDSRQATIGKRGLTDVVLAFVKAIEAGGHRGGVYTSVSWWQNNVYADELRPYANWVAWWTTDRPAAIADCGMWQFGGIRLSDGATVADDVPGYTDGNWCYVDYPAQRGKTTAPAAAKPVENSLRVQVVARARTHLGRPYNSMDDGKQGFGCAMLYADCINHVLGTSYFGGTYNFWGEAIGATVYTQGGTGEFYEIPASEAKPGDGVCYFQGSDTGTSSLCKHMALYVGSSKVIGAWGSGNIGQPGYFAGRGVSEDTVEQQSLGGAIRYIRSRRLEESDKKKTTTSEERDMVCLIHPSKESKVYYWSGDVESAPYHVSGPEKSAIEATYTAMYGAKIPFKEIPQADFDLIMAMCKARKAWREQGIAQAISG